MQNPNISRKDHLNELRKKICLDEIKDKESINLSDIVTE